MVQTQTAKKAGLFKNLYRYREYIMYYAKITLKQKVSGNYLGFLWLLIQPLMFMLIYSFVVTVVFQSGVENFNIFVLIGLNAWTLTQQSIMTAASVMNRHKAIFRQVYFHKFVYPTIFIVSGVYEFLISTCLVLVMIPFSGIPFTWHMLEFFVVLLVQVLFTWGASLIISHIGVYLFDLRNILEFTMRFIFYLSPVMWSYDRLDLGILWFLKLNPAYIVIGGYRNCLMYGRSPDYILLAGLALVSCGLIWAGYRTISRHEDDYSRII